MIENDQTTKLFLPDRPDATLDDAHDAFLRMNMLHGSGVGWDVLGARQPADG